MSAINSSDVLRLRLDPVLKAEASSLANAMGLTISDAVRMFLVRFVADKKLPFVPEVPNKETLEAMAAADRGEVHAVSSVDELFAEMRR